MNDNEKQGWMRLLSKVQVFVVENFLLVGFCGAVIFAFAYPFGGKILYSYQAGQYRIVELLNNIFVFFISGLTLKLEELKTVVKHKVAVIYSLISINFITTLLAFGLIRLPYLTKDFAIGVTIFATVPTTLGVGVALTLLAKGDQILSLFLTVVSNLLGIVTVPFLLNIYLSSSDAIEVDPVKLGIKLAITVLSPTIAGMLVRKVVLNMPALTKKYRVQLSMFSTFNLVMIVWMALSTSRNNLMKQDVGEVMFVVAVSVVMHVIYLCFNALVVSQYMLGIAPRQAVSVIIMASQKSSPVALAVITSLATTDPQQKGLFAIPCIVGQLCQIFIGSFLAPRLVKWVDRREADTAAAEAGTGVDLSLESVEVDNSSYINDSNEESNVLADSGDEHDDSYVFIPHAPAQSAGHHSKEVVGVEMTVADARSVSDGE